MTEFPNTASLGELLLRSARLHPLKECLVFPTTRWTYATLAHHSQQQARALIAAGIRPGDHIGVLSLNRPEMISLLFASALCGAVCVLLNARYRSQELRYTIEHADLRLLFTGNHEAKGPDFVKTLTDAFPALRETTSGLLPGLVDAPLLKAIVHLDNLASPTIPFDQFLAAGERLDAEILKQCGQPMPPRHPAIIMYTSGTTSLPKGCVLSHEAIVCNTAAMASRLELSEHDRMWDPLPMFHMAAILPLLGVLLTGGCYITDTYFRPDIAWSQLLKEQVSFMYPAFPAIMSDILNHPEFDAEQLHAVRMVNNVAPPDTLRANMRAIPNAVHISAYGMTEASGISCHGSRFESDEVRATTCGKPYTDVHMRVVDPETGDVRRSGERGEMQIAGRTLLNEYYKMPQETAAAFSADGWFRTGDLCAIDDAGRVSFHGRLKELIKVGGENVSPLELESFLEQHPEVMVAQTVGMPDKRLGEVVAAFIQRRPGSELSEEELITYCRGRIASFKVPRYVRFVDVWPMSATKIQKHVLRAQLHSELFG